MTNIVCGALLLCLVTLSLTNGCTSLSVPVAKPPPVEDLEYWVSMIEVIANPERYDQKRIGLCGFLDMGGPEGAILYLHKEDYDRGISKNALGVNLSAFPGAKKWDRNYVVVVGTFIAVPRRGRFPYAGALSHITHARPHHREISGREEH